MVVIGGTCITVSISSPRLRDLILILNSFPIIYFFRNLLTLAKIQCSKYHYIYTTCIPYPTFKSCLSLLGVKSLGDKKICTMDFFMLVKIWNSSLYGLSMSELL